MNSHAQTTWQAIVTVLIGIIAVTGVLTCAEPSAQAQNEAHPTMRETQQAALSDQWHAVIEGTVQLSDGTPIENAVIVSSARGQAVSDANGVFALAVEVPMGAESLGMTAVATIGGVNHTANRLVALIRGNRTFDQDTVTLTLHASDDCEPQWLPTFGGQKGVNGTVSALTVFDDGSGDGPALYAGGNFGAAGSASANYIAKWNGNEWSPLGSGMNNKVFALTVFDDGSGDGTALYAGGNFTTAGGAAANGIAKWDGEEWSPLGRGMSEFGTTVRALTIFDDGSGGGPALYAGGWFDTAGGVEVNHIAKWDGEEWSPLGCGLNTTVRALTVFDDGTGGGEALYAGGAFTTAGGASANYIAKWNGNEWSPLGSGMNFWVHALTVFDDGSGAGPALYAGGWFDTAGGVSANHIAKWDGNEWSPLGSGMNGNIFALTVFDDGTGGGPALYAGGWFDNAGGVDANRIAKWDGNEWSPLGSGMSGGLISLAVTALTVFDDGTGSGEALYASGDFTTAGGVEANHIAAWDGNAWSPLGSGVNDWALALTVFDDGTDGGEALYAGGDFTTAGGVEANRIAKWDGNEWSPLGSGMNSSVTALTVFDDGSGGEPALYAGGKFTTAGGASANYIAKWDGEEWSPLDSGTSWNVHALTVFDDGSGDGEALYVGGAFTAAGSVTVNRIAKWDGNEWSPLGSGLDSTVLALTVFDDGTGPALYAGGAFTTAGGVTVNHIAKWDGEEWSPLGSGMNWNVHALTVFDDGTGPAVYAGGAFATAGGVTVNHIAKWDGKEWSPLDSGLNSTVLALTVFDDGSASAPALYAGGWFNTAGGVTLSGIAKWDGNEWSPLGSGMNSSVTALTVFDDGSASAPSLYAGGTFNASPAGDSFIARYQGCPPEPGILGDLTGNGTVGVADLLILINSWGACADCNDCPADLTGDCNVGVPDLLILIGNWG